MEDGLRRAALELPECLHERLRYALVDNGFGYYHHIYLKLESSEQCMNSFLALNAMDGDLGATTLGGVAAERIPIYRSRWMDDDVVRRLGWQIGPEQRFQRFSVGKPTLYGVFVLVQHVPGSSDVRAYVHAGRGA
ncbi:hypothetical protein Prubr_20600 [Polymorphospora rubra]|uniref:Uncharacterized protein n=1 Tax=Polymorphospora rubra TaxID=338584 RepID=A0A810MYJ8_9ACTN|nr:hypothetical protein Prubr_20600 [Polymorphospora rubra]